MAEPLASRYRPPGPLDPARTLAPLVRGPGDPAHRWATDGSFWLASTTAHGVASLQLRRLNATEIAVRTWGPGADLMREQVPALLGDGDDWSQLDLRPAPMLGDVRTARAGLRLTRSGSVFEALLPAILEQRVTGTEAWRAWRLLVRRYGTPAPGPFPDLVAPPPPATVLDIPSWEWHRFGVDIHRVRAVRAASMVADRLQECARLPAADALHRLRLVPGIGAWTAAETVQRVLGCPDTVSVGDFHIPHLVVYALTGRPRGSDEQMLAALAPWRGQRQRIVRLLEASGLRAPRFGPRYRPWDMRAM